ncbi:hypothetical protein [Pyrococcus sp. ST04]|uniref:hypothetical protein n=1 Tax=Pyrococcus sp. ST04 TaxID=1183377 RepID=UPI00064FD1DA|nr:hypothetical protein [Pyrococcus sp. ST04]
MFVRRFDVYNVRDGIAIENFVTSSPEIARGVFEFHTEKADFDMEKPEGIDVFGIAYGEPSTYIGTLMDMQTEERFTAIIRFIRSEELKSKMVIAGVKKLERMKIYFVSRGEYSDILYSNDLKPGREVAFWGTRVAHSKV